MKNSLHREEGVTATKHQRIFVAQLEAIEERQLLSQINELSQLADGLDAEGIVAKFQELVPDISTEPAHSLQRQRQRQIAGLRLFSSPRETKTATTNRR